MKPPTLAGLPKENPSPERIGVVNMRKNLANLPSHQLDLDRVSLYDAMQKRSNVELLDSLGPKAQECYFIEPQVGPATLPPLV